MQDRKLVDSVKRYVHMENGRKEGREDVGQSVQNVN